ncbi:2S seed storage albumin protein-like [Mercurialis annua]|uniref:2S seed storage albumin protein-like n=1 Tax=Mercurialis annua TaxID=3986 RepID=UPI00215F8208|nr:2S seed storage albumin protein-like [Mercurialis annua]
MANLIPTVAAIAVLLIITANASSAYRTATITTTTVDETNPTGKLMECRSDVDKAKLNDCALYLMGSKQGSSSDYVQRCCNEIKRVGEDCQCDALKVVSLKLLEKGMVELDEFDGVIERTSFASSSCGLRQRCRGRSIFCWNF